MKNLSLGNILLIFLNDYPTSYKLMRKALRGHSISSQTRGNLDEMSENTFRVTLSRLRNRGFIENRRGVWKTTLTGFKKIQDNGLLWKINKPKRQIKNLVIIFDIPELERRRRNWLRSELKFLGFVQIQKSVWLGPSPLHKDFLEALRNLKILRYLKFFEAKESDII